MTQHHHQEEEIEISADTIYYLGGLFGGMFIGLILESSLWWVPILGVVGLVFAAFFRATVVKGHGDF
jgi:hypothetical protein